MSTNYPVKQDMEKLLGSVQAEYDRQVSVADYFRKKCEEFRKDDEIKKLEEQLSEVRHYSLHVMNEEEYVEDAAFRAAHYMKCRNGSTFQYELTGTGIGTAISVSSSTSRRTLTVSREVKRVVPVSTARRLIS